jgi:hypothetical protein
MRKFLGFAILLIISLLIPLSVFGKSIKAQTPRPLPTIKPSRPAIDITQEKERRREELRIKIEERLEANRTRVQERLELKQATREARLAQLSQKRLSLIKAYFERLVLRLESAIARLEKLIQRIESRLAIYKQQEPGIDTLEIENKIADAMSLLEDAKMDLEAASGNIDEVLTSDNPKEAFVEVRNIIKGIKTKLVEVHRILVHTIGDIKGLRVGNTSEVEEPSSLTESPSATSSATVEPTETATPTIEPSPTETATPTVEPTPTESPST